VRASTRQNISSSPLARGRGVAGIGARQETGLDLFRGDGTGEDAEIIAGGCSGAIGIEFASFFRTMGSDVTVVEVLPQILPVEDAEIAALARKRFEKDGIKILTNTKVTKLEKKSDSVVATIDDGKKPQTVEFERVISAVGVVGNIENLGLEKLGVKTDRGVVVIDGYGKTNVPGIYAIGDVAGPPMLAHKAEHEGVIWHRGYQGAASARYGQESDPGPAPIAIRK